MRLGVFLENWEIFTDGFSILYRWNKFVDYFYVP